jgi:membrane-associated phospholipid phosphatase
MGHKFILLFAAIMGFYPSIANAKSTIEGLGDIGQIIVPAYAFGMAMGEDGWTGAGQFIGSFGAMQASVIGLKMAIDERRPDGSDRNSFPSGHTASAVSGAAFIHKRYGFQRAIVPYAIAGFTGWSRIYANKHYWHDVAAGAIISGLFVWAFVDKYNVQIEGDLKSVKVGFRTEF